MERSKLQLRVELEMALSKSGVRVKTKMDKLCKNYRSYGDILFHFIILSCGTKH